MRLSADNRPEAGLRKLRAAGEEFSVAESFSLRSFSEVGPPPQPFDAQKDPLGSFCLLMASIAENGGELVEPQYFMFLWVYVFCLFNSLQGRHNLHWSNYGHKKKVPGT